MQFDFAYYNIFRTWAMFHLKIFSIHICKKRKSNLHLYFLVFLLIWKQYSGLYNVYLRFVNYSSYFVHGQIFASQCLYFSLLSKQSRCRACSFVAKYNLSQLCSHFTKNCKFVNLWRLLKLLLGDANFFKIFLYFCTYLMQNTAELDLNKHLLLFL